MIKKIKIDKKIIWSFIILAAVFILPIFANAQYTYSPMEKIPGYESSGSDFPTFIQNLYKFGIWIVGICALLMITIGGFMYLISAGNTSKMDIAKKIITDSLLGLVIALGAYFLLFIINPDLVNINISLAPLTDYYYAKTYSGTYPELPSVTTTLPSGCTKSEWQTVFSNAASQTGVDKCVIQALAAIESSCTQVPKRTYGGRDCSAFQIAADANCHTSCSDLESNPTKAAVCAANYLKTCSSKWRGSPTDQQIRDMYAGYNGGCGALGSSGSCSGQTNEYGNPYKKWDCKVDCGGYCPVPGRTSRFLSYYKQCKGN